MLSRWRTHPYSSRDVGATDLKSSLSDIAGPSMSGVVGSTDFWDCSTDTLTWYPKSRGGGAEMGKSALLIALHKMRMLLYSMGKKVSLGRPC